MYKNFPFAKHFLSIISFEPHHKCWGRYFATFLVQRCRNWAKEKRSDLWKSRLVSDNARIQIQAFGYWSLFHYTTRKFLVLLLFFIYNYRINPWKSRTFLSTDLAESINKHVSSVLIIHTYSWRCHLYSLEHFKILNTWLLLIHQWECMEKEGEERFKWLVEPIQKVFRELAY